MSREAARDRAAPWLCGDKLTEADKQTGQGHAKEEADTTSPALAARAQGVCEGTKTRGWAGQSPEWLSQAVGSQGTSQGRECWGWLRLVPAGRGTGIIQVPWEVALGAQRCRRHSSHLETPYFPILILARAGRGALGTSQDPKSLHEAFALTGRPWQVTRNRRWHLNPQGPSPTPAGMTRNRQQCCQTVAVPASGTRMLGCHSMNWGAAARGAGGIPGVSQCCPCTRPIRDGEGGTRPPLPGLVLASPWLQGPTTALCDGTRHTAQVATHLSDRSRDRLLSREGWRLVRLLDSEPDSASLRPFAAESTLP